MIGIKVTFQSHYHATPWDSNVNQGDIEWPPSPWRVLRALVAGSYFLPENSLEKCKTLILKMAAVLPSYKVPPETVGSHSRHYYPLKDEKSTLILDPFLVFGEDRTLEISWNLPFSQEEKVLLETIISHLSYLGRSESWASWELIETFSEPNVVPSEISSDFKLLSPKDGTSWENLIFSTSTLRNEGWGSPPGTRIVGYWKVQTFSPKKKVPENLTHTLAFSFGQSRPFQKDFMKISERMRTSVCSHLEKTFGFVPSVFSGKNEDGTPLRGNHSHCHYLPIFFDGKIVGIKLYSPQGFTNDQVKTLNRPFRLSLFRKEFKTIPIPPSDFPEGSSKFWVSKTPFVPTVPLHRKSLEEQIRLHLTQLGAPSPETLSATKWLDIDFRRQKDKSNPHWKTNYFVKVSFPTVVEGPLCVGYASHFGLGLLTPKV